jgi:subtilisin family serine protease
MARKRLLLVIAAVFAFAVVAFALQLESASGGDGRQDGPEATQGHRSGGAEDDDDDDEDDDDEGIRLERRPIAGLGPATIRYVPGQLLVRFLAGTSPAEVEGAAARAGGSVVGHIAELGIHVVDVPPAETEEALASLRSEGSVESVERDVLVQGLDTVPNDELWPVQWGLRLVGAPRAWDATRGTSAIVIAVLDTGIDRAHPDLAGATVPGRDLVNDDSDPADDEGHGTSVAGVLAARTNNGEGQAGMCWACSLMPVKVLNSEGSGAMSTVASGIVWAVDHGARVVNMSLGSAGNTNALASAVAYAARKNAVLVAAAGNSNVDTPFYPAAYSDVIGVAATDDADVRYTWSNYGDWVAVAAPGCNAAPRLGGGYIEFCGTSSAAPLVAGIAALALSLNTTASTSEIEQAIATKATPVPGVALFGRVNAPEAMSAVSPNALPPLPQPVPPPAAPPAAPPPPPPAAAPAPPATMAPSNLKRPRLLGRAFVGRRLRIAPGIWNPAPQRLAYQWRRCRKTGGGCRTIRGARGRSYRLRLRDRGRRLRGVVVAVNASGTTRALTGTSAVVRRAQRR